MTDQPPRPQTTGAPLAQVRALLRTLQAPEDVCAMFDALCDDLKQRTGASTVDEIRTTTDDGGNPVLEVRGVTLDVRFKVVRPFDQQPWSCARLGNAPRASSPWTRGDSPGRM